MSCALTCYIKLRQCKLIISICTLTENGFEELYSEQLYSIIKPLLNIKLWNLLIKQTIKTRYIIWYDKGKWKKVRLWIHKEHSTPCPARELWCVFCTLTLINMLWGGLTAQIPFETKYLWVIQLRWINTLISQCSYSLMNGCSKGHACVAESET